MKTDALQRRSLKWVSLLGVLFSSLFIFVNLLRHSPQVAIANAVMSALLIVNLLVFLRTGHVRIHALTGIIILAGFIIVAGHLLGFQVYFWIHVLPWLSFALMGMRGGVLTSSGLFLLFAIILALDPPRRPGDSTEIDILFSFVLVCFTVYIYEKSKLTYEAELERISVTDQLTGTLNRVGFKAGLEQELQRTRRYSRPSALIAMDVDHFKHINDTYGHLVGDRVLATLTSVVRNQLRATDLFARWGGEEFHVLLPETDLAGATLLGDRVRTAVASHGFEKAGTVTLSLGVTQLRGDDSEDSVLKRADDALYRAKHNGRNRIESEA